MSADTEKDATTEGAVLGPSWSVQDTPWCTQWCGRGKEEQPSSAFPCLDVLSMLVTEGVSHSGWSPLKSSCFPILFLSAAAGDLPQSSLPCPQEAAALVSWQAAGPAFPGCKGDGTLPLPRGRVAEQQPSAAVSGRTPVPPARRGMAPGRSSEAAPRSEWALSLEGCR